MAARKADALIAQFNLNEENLRDGFHAMFADKELTRHRLGSYNNPQVAALWTQHVRTAAWVLCVADKPLVIERRTQ